MTRPEIELRVTRIMVGVSTGVGGVVLILNWPTWIAALGCGIAFGQVAVSPPVTRWLMRAQRPPSLHDTLSERARPLDPLGPGPGLDHEERS